MTTSTQLPGNLTATQRQQLIRHRLELGLTRTALARFWGLHGTTIRKWELGLSQSCRASHARMLRNFINGELDADILSTLGDPRKGAYLQPVPEKIAKCVRHFSDCYQLLEERPDLRQELLEAAFEITDKTLANLLAAPQKSKLNAQHIID